MSYVVDKFSGRVLPWLAWVLWMFLVMVNWNGPGEEDQMDEIQDDVMRWSESRSNANQNQIKDGISFYIISIGDWKDSGVVTLWTVFLL